MTGPRLTGTMVRVADLERSIRFYVDGFGMEVLARTDRAAIGETAVRLGFGGDGGAPIELVGRRDETAPYSHGTGYGHVAVGVESVPAAFARLIAMGAGIVLAPGVLAPGGPCCAFVSDPDGYAVELVETRTAPVGPDGFDPDNVILGPCDGRRRILHTMLRIADVDAALRFYLDGLGMALRARVDIAFKGGVTGLFVGYDDGAAGRLLELTCYHQVSDAYTLGSGYGHVSIDIQDHHALIERLRAMSIICQPVEREGKAGIPSRFHVRDPDGYMFEIVENCNEQGKGERDVLREPVPDRLRHA